MSPTRSFGLLPFLWALSMAFSTTICGTSAFSAMSSPTRRSLNSFCSVKGGLIDQPLLAQGFSQRLFVFVFFQAGRGKEDRFEVTVDLNWTAIEALCKAFSALFQAQGKRSLVRVVISSKNSSSLKESPRSGLSRNLILFVDRLADGRIFFW